jgi:predicted nucleotidyltransferase
MPVNLAPVLEILRAELPELVAVYLFGSVAYGADTADSDVDLAVFAGQPLARTRVLDLQEKLANALRREVDLVDLAAASTILQMQALGEGRLIAAPQPVVAALFELRVMREYQDLKERRADLEADVVRRGRIYA